MNYYLFFFKRKNDHSFVLIIFFFLVLFFPKIFVPTLVKIWTSGSAEDFFLNTSGFFSVVNVFHEVFTMLILPLFLEKGVAFHFSKLEFHSLKGCLASSLVEMGTMDF